MRRHRSPWVAIFCAVVLLILGVCEAVKLNKLEKVCTRSTSGIVYDVRRGGRTGYKAWISYQVDGQSHKLYVHSYSLITAGSRAKVLYDEKVPTTSYSPDYPPRSGILSICLSAALGLYGGVFLVQKKREKSEELY